jgi:hypothetical protein
LFNKKEQDSQKSNSKDEGFLISDHFETNGIPDFIREKGSSPPKI